MKISNPKTETWDELEERHRQERLAWIIRHTPISPDDTEVEEMTRISSQYAAMFGISVKALRGPSRAQHTFKARSLAMKAIYDLHRNGVRKYSTTLIGRFFQRDHSSVIHAVSRADDFISRDPSLRRTF